MAEDFVNLPFEEAIDFLMEKRPTPKAVFDLMTIEAQQRAFTASRVLKLELLQDMLEQIQEAVSSGLSLPDFVASFQDSGLTKAHLETIFRTNLQSAYGRGSFDLLTDSDIADAIWGWRYQTVGDERVREEHVLLDQRVFAMGAHDELYPPNDFNCRCSAEPVTKFEAQSQGLETSDVPDDVRQAMQETDFASPALGVPYRADLTGYDPGLISEFVTDQENR